MKKGKIVSMPSTPEAQIRGRARNLPVGKCYVNKNWREAQMASVLVSRKHVNGNVTFGFFLVDLNLLGVKDCVFAFNESPREMEERVHNPYVEFVECDYALAHNIIYEGIAFADDFGFEPVKDFTKTGVYILEEDSDDIPAMDIPLGRDGVPVVFVSPDRDMRREIAILEKTAGKGNFHIIYVDDKGYLDEEDDDEEDDDYDDDDDFGTPSYDEVMNDIMKTGLDRYVDKYRDGDLSPMQTLALSDISYYAQFGLSDANATQDLMMLILDDKRFDRELLNIIDLEKYADTIQSVNAKIEEDEDAAFQELEAFIAKNLDDLDLAILHINILRDYGERREDLEKLTLYWYNRAGDHYVVRLLYAELLIEQERYDEVFELFGNHPGLDALTTEDKPFNDITVSEFCACYLRAWLSKNNIAKAEPYYRIILHLENWTNFVRDALWIMKDKKRNASIEKIQSEEMKDE